jgi:hypothetical protein
MIEEFKHLAAALRLKNRKELIEFKQDLENAYSFSSCPDTKATILKQIEYVNRRLEDGNS